MYIDFASSLTPPLKYYYSREIQLYLNIIH